MDTIKMTKDQLDVIIMASVESGHDAAMQGTDINNIQRAVLQQMNKLLHTEKADISICN